MKKQNEASKSTPEKLGHWLFKQSSNWRIVLAFGLIAALTGISIRFNIELGRLSAVDETSKSLLPSGYALLDMAALFLSGYIGIKTRSPVRKFIAWVWFAFLVTLSLWAAAAFTMSVDYRQSLAPLDAQIERKRAELTTQQASVKTWQDNVAAAKMYKTKHQGTLSREQIKESMIAGELAHLEAQRVPAAQIIYERAAPYVGVDAETLQLIIRLLWAGAITLSPLVLALLLGAEVVANNHLSQDSPTPPNDGTKPKKKSFTDKFHDSVTLKNAPANMDTVTANASERIRAKNVTSPASKGVQKDTGTEGDAAHRFAELRKNVLSGHVKPSIRQVRSFCGCRQEVAIRYIEKLAGEGIIQRKDNGRYELVSNVVPLKRQRRAGLDVVTQTEINLD